MNYFPGNHLPPPLLAGEQIVLQGGGHLQPGPWAGIQRGMESHQGLSLLRPEPGSPASPTCRRPERAGQRGNGPRCVPWWVYAHELNLLLRGLDADLLKGWRHLLLKYIPEIHCS